MQRLLRRSAEPCESSAEETSQCWAVARKLMMVIDPARSEITRRSGLRTVEAGTMLTTIDVLTNLLHSWQRFLTWA
jgi:RNA polymerase subunit RPABC4/transcription elongation factor Spt4